MKNTALHIYLVAAVLSYGCKEMSTQTAILYKPEQLTTIDVEKLPSNISIADYIQSIEFIPLEANDSSILSGIDKIHIKDGKLFILDRTYSSMHVFSQTGKYLNRIGELGLGPGQFRTLNDFYLKDSTLLLLCNDKKSILSFTPTGKYLSAEKIDLWAYNFESLNNQWYFFINQNGSDRSGNNNVVVMDAAMGRVTEKLFSYPKTFKGSFSFSGFLRKNDEGLIYSNPVSDTVYQIEPTVIYPKYAFSFGGNRVPDEVKKTFAAFMKDGLKYSYLQADIYENSAVLMFSYQSHGIISYGFYDKKTKQSMKQSNIESDVFSRLIDRTIGVIDDNKFVATISPEYLLKVIKDDTRLLTDVKNQWGGLYNLLGNLKMDGNPVLVIYTLKPVANNLQAAK